jgi:long-chain fatty acid transport protein
MIGVGLDIYYSKLELTAVNTGPTTTVDSKGEGDGWGLGANAALTWLPVEKQRVSLVFKSGVDMDYEGDFSVGGVASGDFKTAINYPNSIGIGYGIELGKSVQLEALVEWLQWSVNESQTLEAGANPPRTFVNNWDDTVTLGLGGSWQALDSLVVRAGYAYLPSPVPDNTMSPLLPDTDRQALSIGLGYALGGHVFDIAYTFSLYSDRASPVGNQWPGTYDVDSNLLGLTYSWYY